jgi:solute carrier family 25 oxoglutarate transporter 11
MSDPIPSQICTNGRLLATFSSSSPPPGVGANDDASVVPSPNNTSNVETAAALESSAVKSRDEVISLPTRMVLSAVAGMGGAVVCHPLDVIRVQMQTSSSSEFTSTWHAATSIYRNAGLRNGLYAGISAAFLRQWLYGSCRMGIYSYLLEQQQLTSPNGISFSSKLAMGCISGGIGSLVGTPSELALVRMSADSKLPKGERRNYTSVFNCLARIAKEEGGIKMWWTGSAPTVIRATLLSSASLGVTSQAKTELSKSGLFGPDGQWAGGFPLLFCATLISSFCANVVANPFDVVKSRLQNMVIPPATEQGRSLPRYSGVMDCFAKSIQAEGIMVLWAGFVPAFLKLAPYSIISLTLVDKLTKAVTGKDAL